MDTDCPSRNTLFLMAVLVEGGLLLLAVAGGWLLGLQPVDLIQWRWQAAALGALVSLPLVLLLIASQWVPLAPLENLVRVIDELLVPMFRHSTVAELAVISLLAGLGEELLFRGLIQEGLSRWWGGTLGPYSALLVASLLFGALHCITPTYAMLATAIGLLLGGLWMGTGNLLVPISTHAVYDFLALVWMVRLRKRSA